MALTYVNLASTTLGSNQSTVIFNNISQAYTDLVLRWSSRDTQAAVDVGGFFIFNGVSTQSYSYRLMASKAINGAAAASEGAANQTGFLQWSMSIGSTNSAYPSTLFGNGELYFPNYTTNSSVKPFWTHTSSEVDSSVFTGAYGNVISAGQFRSTSAITSIQFTAGSSFITNSRFYLYGIKNA